MITKKQLLTEHLEGKYPGRIITDVSFDLGEGAGEVVKVYFRGRGNGSSTEMISISDAFCDLPEE